MASLRDTLSQLHTHRTDLTDVRDQLKQGPAQAKASQAKLDKRAAGIDTLKAELRALRKESDAKELQLKTGESRLRDLRGKLNQATNTKEFDALKEEMKRVEAGNATLENEGLEQLGAQEAKQAAIAAAEQELAAAKVEHDKLKATIDYQVEKHTARVRTLEEAIAKLESDLEPECLAAYRRAVATKGDAGLNAAQSGACSSCYTGLTPQAVQGLKAGKFVSCTSCGAVLFAPD